VQGVALKVCSRCKQAPYCGAACQKAAWKGHKVTCMTLKGDLRDVFQQVVVANSMGDWRGVLKWEGRIDELLENQSDTQCDAIFQIFVQASWQQISSTSSHDKALKLEKLDRLEERRVDLLGKMERFRDQGEGMCSIGQNLLLAQKAHDAKRWFQRGRDVGEAHG